MSEPVDEVAAAEAARVQAEARRQRILSKSNKRMGLVSGEQLVAEEDKSASEAKAARIRAARQRRYGKKTSNTAAVKAEAPVEASNDNQPEAQPTEQEESPFDEQTVSDEKKPAPEDASKSMSDVGTSDGEKKKYMGVARMRRNMILKKKQEEEASDATADKEALEKMNARSSVAPGAIYVSKVPIYMHVVTVLLLFLAGLDVSIQQYHPSVSIESEFAVKQHGVPVIHRSLGPATSTDIKDSSLPDWNKDTRIADGVNDEFADEDEKEPNIDPVFGVDLDDLTKGPGIMNQLARGAVWAHRTLIWFVYHLPLSIFQSFLGIPQALLRSPPILCIIAMVLRHGVGKVLLGAALPEDAKSDNKSIDVLAMAKNFVTNMLSTNFPTLVTIYGAFSHLRSDMYIVLCGVFTGLVYVHLGTSGNLEGSPSETATTIGTDEL